MTEIPPAPPAEPRGVNVERQLEQLQLAQNQLAIYARDLSRTYRNLRETQAKLEASYFATLSALAATLEARDSYVDGHSRSVASCAWQIGLRMGMAVERLEALRRAALLHDIGKIGIPDSVLKKPGRLTESQQRQMRQHPELGYQMLSGLGFLEEVLPAIRHHHERFDGHGYPLALAGTRIPLFARILSVCDAYDAMTSDRPYRTAMSTSQAIEEIRKQMGAQFDPEIAEIQVRIIQDSE